MERMITAGYMLGKLLPRAVEYDERMMAPAQDTTTPVEAPTTQLVEVDSTYPETWDASLVKPAIEEVVLERDEELRQRYKVNEARSTEKEIAMAKAICLDEKFKILEPATMSAEYATQGTKLVDERYKVTEKTVAPCEKAVSMAKAGYHSLKNESLA